MSAFQLKMDDLTFPPAYRADAEGLLAVGGDLDPKRVIEAYRNGIYFWFAPDDPVHWWSPDPRVILRAGEVHPDPGEIAHSALHLEKIRDLGPLLRKIQTRVNEGEISPYWLTEEMYNTYMRLHEDGHCEGFDIYCDHEHVGSLFGIVVGRVFFLEYVYPLDKDRPALASHICIYALAKDLHRLGYELIDVQKGNIDISDFGIIEVSRTDYLQLLRENG